MQRIFDLQARLGADECAINARDLQNNSIDKYTKFNSYVTNRAKCGKEEDDLRKFAAINHVTFKDGLGFTNQCRVDNDSQLRNGSKWTHDRARIQLYPRVFQGVPDFSHGGSAPVLESRLVQGEDTAAKRSCNVLAEVNIDRFDPLIKCMSDNVQNPDNIVPTWTWGGEPTRDTVRQRKFLEANGYMFDGVAWRKKLC